MNCLLLTSMEQETTFIYSPLVNIYIFSLFNAELTLRVDKSHYLRGFRRAYAGFMGDTDNLSPHGRE